MKTISETYHNVQIFTDEKSTRKNFIQALKTRNISFFDGELSCACAKVDEPSSLRLR